MPVNVNHNLQHLWC